MGSSFSPEFWPRTDRCIYCQTGAEIHQFLLFLFGFLVETSVGESCSNMCLAHHMGLLGLSLFGTILGIGRNGREKKDDKGLSGEKKKRC